MICSVLPHRNVKARGGSNVPGMLTSNQSPSRQITFLGHVNGAATSSIEAVVAIGDVVMTASPINGSAAVATPVFVGSVVSETEAPLGTNEAAVPERSAIVVFAVEDTESCVGSASGPSPSPKVAVSVADAGPSSSGTRAVKSIVAVSPPASLPSEHLVLVGT